MPTPDYYTLIQLQQAVQQKDQKIAELTQVLGKAREVVAEAKAEVDRLNSPPQAIALFGHPYGDDKAVVLIRGERTLVEYDEKKTPCQPGQEIVINENLAIVEALSGDVVHLGDVRIVNDILDDGRLVVSNDQDEEVVVLPHFELAIDGPEVGDRVLVNLKSAVAYELLPDNGEATEHLLEHAPNIAYSDIGGLSAQIAQITDAVELPFLHRDLFKTYKLQSPKGVLLYGPPGVGKTLIAKAIANSLAQKAGVEHGYFININGPELLSKWVGETERQIRELFGLARSKGAEGIPVVLFFDELESLFPIRGSGVSSDTEKTIVPQILSELDGVEEGMDNVIVIGATNRQDLVDPALLRPGRLDIKVKIERPDIEGAAEILSIYLNGAPVREPVPVLVREAVNSIFDKSEQNKFLEVTYNKGEQEILYFSDFISGALLANVVNRAKRAALKAELAGEPRGILWEHMLIAINEEFAENEDLPNTTSPDDWARISGRHSGDKVVNVRSLVQLKKSRATTKFVEEADINRQYL